MAAEPPAGSRTPRPALVEIGRDGVCVHTGPVRLPTALAAHLGPARALRLLAALRRLSPGSARRSTPSPRREGPGRRAVLGGILGAVALAAVPARAWGVGVRPAPTLDRPTPADVAALRASPTVALAVGRFGAADWTSSACTTARPGSPPALLVPLDHPVAGRSWLATGPATAALVVRPADVRTGTPALHLYRPDGRPIAVVAPADGRWAVPLAAPLPPDSFRSPSSPASPGAATDRPDIPSKAFFICLNNCLQANGVADAIPECDACLRAGSAVEAGLHCPQCAVLALGHFGPCIDECTVS